MTVLRFENGIPYVQLNLGERNLNDEIRALLPQSSAATTAIVIKLNSKYEFLSVYWIDITKFR